MFFDLFVSFLYFWDFILRKLLPFCRSRRVFFCAEWWPWNRGTWWWRCKSIVLRYSVISPKKRTCWSTESRWNFNFLDIFLDMKGEHRGTRYGTYSQFSRRRSWSHLGLPSRHSLKGKVGPTDFPFFQVANEGVLRSRKCVYIYVIYIYMYVYIYMYMCFFIYIHKSWWWLLVIQIFHVILVTSRCWEVLGYWCWSGRWSHCRSKPWRETITHIPPNGKFGKSWTQKVLKWEKNMS